MLPDTDRALKELAIAEKLNPGAWVQHSRNVGIAARNIAKRVDGLIPEKAYVLGLLHDIGRRVGVVGAVRHVWEGYRYCMENGWDEVARVCMTHSFPLAGKELDVALQEKEAARIREYVLGCEYDDYDFLIQLCDSLATSRVSVFWRNFLSMRQGGMVSGRTQWIIGMLSFGLRKGLSRKWVITYMVCCRILRRRPCSIFWNYE